MNVKEPELVHPYHEYALPYKNSEGNVVTITWEQIAAIRHCIKVWSMMCDDEGSGQAKNPDLNSPNTLKSRALGRLLLEGKPLFKDKPPMYLAAANYYQWDVDNGTVQPSTQYFKLT